ncbi:hypothetical protein [Actinokineospora inagensis]|uniref:hypothetical protein n=1 Tax=Actinokineospora inagensis TaxID=103730 RepID=UPI0004062023|nr:hypothetical protein [Actinokineospora inagensis]
MSRQDWNAVARTINRRMEFLDISQTQLVDRSRVSKLVIRELQHNLVQRLRSPRTLEAVSTALGLAPTHLDAVLHGRQPPPIPSSKRAPTPVPAYTPLTLHDLRNLNIDSRGIRHLQRRLEEWIDNLQDLGDLLTDAERLLGITPDSSTTTSKTLTKIHP